MDINVKTHTLKHLEENRRKSVTLGLAKLIEHKSIRMLYLQRRTQDYTYIFTRSNSVGLNS